jgi:hypothetical protein
MFLARVAGLLGRGRLADECRFVARGLTWTHLKPHPGYTGWPALASREAGAAFAEAILERYVPQVLAALEGRRDAPAPILGWLTPLTLNGRLIP